MNGLDIGLPRIRTWGYGGMSKAFDLMDGMGEVAVMFGVPGADEFGAVVGLDSGFIKSDAAFEKVLDDDINEEGGIDQRTFLGVGDELKAADDLTGRVLDLG